MSEDIPQNVIEAIKAAAEDGRISCEKALELANELEAPTLLVGRALDFLEIKVTSCQLGCF
ncbi:MAG: hypothetical protein CVT63_08305 [Candidatus Anoxymicrobium japonicum]|uniref:Uncharacterized protein n=1 Tax=Candidatus Anoxymicrobium japonicum TaxID=2013648 RepID=A0A2N3G2C0_9ACTN|nr:MAG: hypothetical protein CVT63_08305 [Candidatus Anoxymicrobium japonicum]